MVVLQTEIETKHPELQTQNNILPNRQGVFHHDNAWLQISENVRQRIIDYGPASSLCCVIT